MAIKKWIEGSPALMRMPLKVQGSRFFSPVFVLVATFVAAYVPTMYTVMTSHVPVISALKEPDVVGGLMGLLFSVVLSIGEAYHHQIKEALDQLNRKIEAQSHGYRVQEAYLKAKDGPFAPLFGELAELRLKAIHSDLANMESDPPFYEARQNDPVKEYVDIFVQLMLKIIQPGSEFRVVTTEVIWSPDSFGGPDRRYLLANHTAAKERKIKIDRIFMVQSDDKLRENPKMAQRILETLRDHRRTFKEDSLRSDISVYRAESDLDYHSFFRSPSNNFALWKVSKDHTICTVVEYHYVLEQGYRISGFKFTPDPLLIKEKSAVFEDLHNRAVSLQEYIGDLEKLIGESGKPKPESAAAVGSESTLANQPQGPGAHQPMNGGAEGEGEAARGAGGGPDGDGPLQ